MWPRWALACLQVCFEVFISEHLAVDFGEDHQELDPHIVRIGWSTDSHNFQLGNTTSGPLSQQNSNESPVSPVITRFKNIKFFPLYFSEEKKALPCYVLSFFRKLLSTLSITCIFKTGAFKLMLSLRCSHNSSLLVVLWDSSISNFLFLFQLKNILSSLTLSPGSFPLL